MRESDSRSGIVLKRREVQEKSHRIRGRDVKTAERRCMVYLVERNSCREPGHARSSGGKEGRT